MLGLPRQAWKPASQGGQEVVPGANLERADQSLDYRLQLPPAETEPGMSYVVASLKA